MKKKVGDIAKCSDGVLRELVELIPHAEVRGSYYYKFHDGYVERDIRFHGEWYRKIQ